MNNLKNEEIKTTVEINDIATNDEHDITINNVHERTIRVTYNLIGYPCDLIKQVWFDYYSSGGTFHQINTFNEGELY